MIVGIPLGSQPFNILSCTGSQAASALCAAAVKSIVPRHRARGEVSGSVGSDPHTLQRPFVGGCSVGTGGRMANAVASAFQRCFTFGAMTSSLPEAVNRLVPNILAGVALDGFPATFTLSPTLSAARLTLDRLSTPTE